MITAGRTRTLANVGSVPWLTLLFIAGAAVRLWGIDAPLQGDDYNTLREAESLGRNFNGLLYFTLLHFWAPLVRAEWWYRLPGVLFGLLAIPVAYYAGHRLGGRRVGLLSAALVALSPFAVSTTHLIRTYSLFLTASFLAILAALDLLEAPHARRRWVLLGMYLMFLPLAHVFGLLLAMAIVLWLYVIKGVWPAKPLMRVGLVGAVLILLFCVLLYAPARAYGWGFIQASIGSLRQVDFQSSRGVGLAQLAKIPIALYLFALGPSVYPLTWWLVIPALVLVGACGMRGIAELRSRPAQLALLVVGLSLLVLVFLLFDAVVPANTETAGPRHVTMAWPAFSLLIAYGAARFRYRAVPAALMFITAAGLSFTWFGDWSYSGETGPDWRTIARLADQPTGAILYDGRSLDPVNWYFSPAPTRVAIWDQVHGEQQNLPSQDHLLVISNDFQPQRRQEVDTILSNLSKDYTLTIGQVVYPLFAYRLDRKPEALRGTTAIGQNGQLQQPLSIYGLEFQDLRLPMSVIAGGTQLSIAGAFKLPSSSGELVQALRLASNPKAHSIILLTNVIGAERLVNSQPIAELITEDDQGRQKLYPIRIGEETADWTQACDPLSVCRTVLQWHKHIALVGQQSYPGAWRDFQAGIHATSLLLPGTSKLRRITIRYTATTGNLYVWGIAVQ